MSDTLYLTSGAANLFAVLKVALKVSSDVTLCSTDQTLSSGTLSKAFILLISKCTHSRAQLRLIYW